MMEPILSASEKSRRPLPNVEKLLKRNDEQYSIALERDHVTMINSNASFESLLRESCPDRPSADFFNTISATSPSVRASAND
jgi:hypothetical protein